jgi:DNA-binding transcriptional MerR regulator
MFKIGDLSKLSRVSVKTLRYYDEIGLLKPAQVDRFTGYRYYSFDQLPRLNRILALKDLGFSLEQIAQVLNEGLPPAQLRGMLRLRQMELRDLLE